MAERKKPDGVLHEGPRACFSDQQVRQIEALTSRGLDVDIDDVIEYVHKDMRSLPDYTTLYPVLKQRWDVYDLDFSQDRSTGPRRDRRGTPVVPRHRVRFHHGERQVEIELPVFMIARARRRSCHRPRIETRRGTRCLRPVLPQGRRAGRATTSWHPRRVVPWVSETFAGRSCCWPTRPTNVRKNPYDERARVRYGTTYFLWIEGVLACRS